MLVYLLVFVLKKRNSDNRLKDYKQKKSVSLETDQLQSKNEMKKKYFWALGCFQTT